MLVQGVPRGTSGRCRDSPSKGRLPLCWPEGPCSQKPGQTPLVRCVSGVPARGGRGGVRNRKLWGPGIMLLQAPCLLGHPQRVWAPALLTGALQPCSGLSQSSAPSLKEAVPPFPCSGAASVHGEGREGSGCRSNVPIVSACGVIPRKPG